MDYIQLISAAGIGGIIGSLLTTLVQAWLANKQRLNDRAFQEKKEVYAGFLDAIYKSDIQNTEETASYLAHWKNRIELVGSNEAMRLCNRFFETNPVNNQVHPERPQVFRDLKEAMRKDLGVHIGS